MADVGTIATLGHLARKTFNVLRDAKNAPQEQKDFAEEMHDLQVLLERLNKKFGSSKNDSAMDSTREDTMILQGPFKLLNEILENLGARIFHQKEGESKEERPGLLHRIRHKEKGDKDKSDDPKQVGSKQKWYEIPIWSADKQEGDKLTLMDAWIRLGWHQNKKDCDETFRRIQRINGLLMLVLQEDMSKTLEVMKKDCGLLPEMQQDIRVVKQGVDVVKEDIRESSHRKQRDDVLTWLSSENSFLLRQQDLTEKKVDNTCQWFFERPEFKSWLNSEHGILRCHGGRGSGKTVMVSAIVSYLRDYFPKDVNVHVAYVYFDYDKRNNLPYHHVMRTICRQLMNTRATLSENLIDLYSECQKSNHPPTNEDIRSLLIEEAEERPTFILIDALDECRKDDKSEWDDTIQELMSKTHLLVTSPSADETAFEDQSSIEITADRQDLERYVLHRIKNDDKLREMRDDVDLERLLINKVIKGAENRFLLVRLRVESLNGTIRDIREQLEQLPMSLTETYEQAWTRIESQDDAVCKRSKEALAWVMNVSRQLTPAELIHILATRRGDSDFNVEGQSRIVDIISSCAGLLVVDSVDKTVRFDHKGAKKDFPRCFDSMYGHDAQLEIARKCLTYLNFQELNETDSDRDGILKVYPFTSYAAYYWGEHARGRIEEDYEIQTLARQLLSRDKRPSDQFRTTPEPVHDLDQYPGSSHLRGGMHGLHLAASFGLTTIVSMLLDEGSEVDELDDDNQTALHWACNYGHKDTALLLLRRNADVNARVKWNDCTPLIIASARDHPAVVKLLIKHEADVNAVSRHTEFGLPALHTASLHGRPEIVKKLLKAGARIKVEDRSALTYAIRRAHLKVLGLLTKQPESVQGADGWLAVRQAIDTPRPKLISVLLSAGVDVNLTPDGEEPLIEYAIRLGRIKCAIEMSKSGYPSPLSQASRQSAVQELLQQDYFTCVEVQERVQFRQSDQNQGAKATPFCMVYSREISPDSTSSGRLSYLGLKIPENVRTVQKLVFHIESHDQDLTDDTQAHGSEEESKMSFTCLVIPQNRPDSAWVEIDIKKVVHASAEPQDHIVTWEHDSPDQGIADLIGNLSAGDVVQVSAKAKRAGWVNFVEKVEVEVWAME